MLAISLCHIYVKYSLTALKTPFNRGILCTCLNVRMCMKLKWYIQFFYVKSTSFLYLYIKKSGMNRGKPQITPLF